MKIPSVTNSLPYIIITALAFFMFRGIFAPGFMSGYDNSFHYYDAYYLTKTLIPQYRWISGWSMQGMAGMPILVDYYQIGFLLIAILNKILFLPLNLSYKIMVLLSYIFLGAGFYKISSYRFGPIPSFLASVCLMLQKDIYYDRILGGIWNNYLALGLFFIFFHTLDNSAKDMTIKKSIILGLLLGLLILAHLYVAVFAFIVLLIYTFFSVLDMVRKRIFARQLLGCAFIPITSFLISSYYLYGFVVARNYFSKMPTKDASAGLAWGLKSFFGPLENGVSVISTFMINLPIIMRIIFGFLGICIFLKKEKDFKIRRFLTCVIVFIFISLVLFSDILVNLFNWWHAIPLIGNLQTNRFLIYVQIGMYLFAAYGIAGFLKYFRRKKFATAALTISLLASLFFHYTYLARNGSRTLEESPEMSNVYRVWDWVNENISTGERRIVYQDTMWNTEDPILARSDVFALSGVFTQVPQIGVSRPASPFPQEKYMRNDHGHIFGMDISKVDAVFIGDMMRHFNAGYIVSVEPNLKNKLLESGLFFIEREFGPFSIFELKDFTSNWINFTKDAEYKNTLFENQNLEFQIWNNSLNNEAFLKFAYHPLWRAWLNDEPVDIKQDKYSLMKVDLPDLGYYRLKLSFNSFNLFWTCVSSLSFLTSIAVIAMWKE